MKNRFLSIFIASLIVSTIAAITALLTQMAFAANIPVRKAEVSEPKARYYAVLTDTRTFESSAKIELKTKKEIKLSRDFVDGNLSELSFLTLLSKQNKDKILQNPAKVSSIIKCVSGECRKLLGLYSGRSPY